MVEIINKNLTKSISWASVFAGVLAVLSISFLLSLLGAALGFALLDPTSQTDVTNHSGTAVTIWTIVSLLVSLGIGGYLAGKLAGIDGGIHGFLVWSLALLLGIIFSIMTINSAVKTTLNTIGSISSMTGSLVSGIGSGSAQLLDSTDIFKNVVPSESTVQEGQNNLSEILKKSNIPQLQPNYLNTQVDWAKEQTEQAVKDIAINPQQYKEILNNLVTSLQERVKTINNSIDEQEVKKAILANSSMTPAEADRAAHNFFEARNEAVVKSQQFFDQLVVNINQSQEKYEQLKEQAREQAAIATNAAAKAALWSFIGLFIGMLCSLFAGRFGALSKQH